MIRLPQPKWLSWDVLQNIYAFVAQMHSDQLLGLAQQVFAAIASLFQNTPHREDRTLAQLALHRDIAIHHSGQAPAARQPKPSTAALPRRSNRTAAQSHARPSEY